MALIFEDGICPFCGQLLQDGRETGAMTALFDAEHKYAICSDSGFHIECFEKWEHSAAVKDIYEKLEKLSEKKPTILEGMNFDEFEKTSAYKEYMDKMDVLLERAQ